MRLAPPSALVATSGGQIGNPSGYTPDQSAVYTDPGLALYAYTFVSCVMS